MRFPLEKNWMHFLKEITREVDSVTSKSGEHSCRVAGWAQAVTQQLGLEGEAVQDIYWGALFHDIGKIGIPTEILTKNSALTRREWEIMELHPMMGAKITKVFCPLMSVVSMIQSHQERYDGNGYPGRLGGEDIPMGARILAVVDAYDAMTDDRPYRKARMSGEALDEIVRNKGQQFDPEVVDVFLNVFQESPIM